MNTTCDDTVLQSVQIIFQRADTLLIVVSRPVDPDCIGTALALQWFLEQYRKTVDIVSFERIPDTMVDFPDIDKVLHAGADSFGFERFQAIILVDGSSWVQFFGDATKTVLSHVDTQCIVNIDHHQPDDIKRTIPERSLNAYCSCTAQLLYDVFILPSRLVVPPRVADYMYRALLYDTRNFKNEHHDGMFTFAEMLLTWGADHAGAVDVSHDMRSVDYLCWAVEHTEFIPELGLSVLLVDRDRQADLRSRLGEYYMDFDALYKETILRQIRGYNYGIILHELDEESVKLSWRTRSYGNHIPVADAALRAGFNAGGHRNAGGGYFTGSIAEAREVLLKEIKRALSASE